MCEYKTVYIKFYKWAMQSICTNLECHKACMAGDCPHLPSEKALFDNDYLCKLTKDAHL